MAPVIAITVAFTFALDASGVAPLPLLHLYVTSGCTTCRRAERVVRDCDALRELVRLQVHNVGEGEAETPPGVVGVPALVYAGEVVSLGTPDCCELADRISSMLLSPA